MHVGNEICNGVNADGCGLRGECRRMNRSNSTQDFSRKIDPARTPAVRVPARRGWSITVAGRTYKGGM